MTACATTDTAPVGESRLFVGPTFVVPGGTAAAILVGSDGTIEAVFESLPATEGWRREVLPGALALPGLVDSHLHVTWIGRTREQLDLEGASSLAEVRARLAAYAEAHPEVATIVGHGWDQTLWGDTAFPTSADLGDLAKPVVLTRIDGHAVWLNAAAMAIAKPFFDAPPAAPGMRIERADGHPTGVVVDAVPALWDLVTPPADEATLTRWIARGLAECADAGMVEVHDMATSPAELAVMQKLAATGLPVRVVVYLDDSDASFAWLAAHPGGAPQVLGPDLIVAGMKLFADGALGSRGAALKEDYSDMHGHRGLPTGPEALRDKAVRAAQLGYPVAIHAIGDLGNDHALSAIEAAQRARDTLNTKDVPQDAQGLDARHSRHPPSRASDRAVTSSQATRLPARLVNRIEHAQVIDLRDLNRFASTGTIASMQPTHATSDMRWAEARVGPERIKGAYAWNTILHRGIPLAFGSDAPVEHEDPLVGLFAAVFRETAKGDPPGGWRPSEALTFREALAAFTAGASVAAPGAGRTGRLEVGAPFEVTLLDQDVLTMPRLLVQARALGTARGHRLRTR